MYEQVFRPAMWPTRLIERCLAGFAEVNEVRQVIGVLSATTGYSTVFRRTRWPRQVDEVILASPESTTGAMVKAPRAQGEWLAAFAELRRASDVVVKFGWSAHGDHPAVTSNDPRVVEALIAALTDEPRAEPPRSFPSDRELASHPGLYSWWGDEEARSMIGTQLGTTIPSLVYAGQAGATRWPSGTTSTATLASRIRGNHINGNASSSTFRLTLSALLLDPLGLAVLKPGRLTPEDNRVVSGWIKKHLQVAIVAYDDRDSLGRIEAAVLDILDPPLNLEGRPSTSPRRRLTSLRRRITSSD